MMDRRAFLSTLGLLAAPLAVEGQLPAKPPEIGVLSGGFATNDQCLEALREGLREAAVEGQWIN